MNPETVEAKENRVKSPRQYAADFVQSQGREAQKAALAGCPEEWQELVKLHIKIYRMRQ